MRTFAAPFGRYQAGGEVETPAQQVLVGREGQRRYFVELLLQAGRRGAYLVTGHRGVGKSSFVKHCLSEYVAEVFERFLRSNVGRSVFWDRIMIAAVGAMLLFSVLMISELIEILVQLGGDTQGLSGRGLRWLLIVPLSIVCLLPLLFAREVISASLYKIQNNRWREFCATILMLVVTLFAAVLLPLGAPAVSASRLFLAICAVYAGVQIGSGAMGDGVLPKGSAWAKGLWRAWRRIIPAAENQKPSPPLDLTVTSVRLSLFLAAPFLLLIGPAHLSSIPVEPQEEFSGNLLLASILLACGLGLQSYRCWLRSRNGSQGTAQRRGLNAAFQSYLVGALLALAASAGLALLWRKPFWTVTERDLCPWPQASPFWAISPGLLVLFLSSCKAIGWRRSGEETAKLPGQLPTPCPRAALVLRASLSIVIALQLVQPAFVPFFGHSESSSCPVRTSPVREPISIYHLTLASDPSHQRPGFVFQRSHEDLLWLLAILLSLASLYFLEYEWVVRPYIEERAKRPRLKDGEGSGPGGYAGEAAVGSSIYRRMAELTLPWLVYRQWLPVITVSVNLGFEKLDHRRVVQAMLAGLRDKYHQAFLAWGSGLANLGRLLGLLILLSFVSRMGHFLFAPPQVTSPFIENRLREQSRNNYLDICHAFQGRQSGHGVVHLICQLKHGSAAVSVLYHDLVSDNLRDSSFAADMLLLSALLPYQERNWPSFSGVGEPFLRAGLHFRVYHLLLLIFFWLIGRWLVRKFPVLPYRSLLKKIDDVMDKLTASTSVTSRVGRWQPAQWLEGFFLDERVKQTQQDPFDPRTVEFLFLQILEDVQKSSIRLSGMQSHVLSLPVPEITFVFDELDKLGTRIEPVGEGESLGPSHQVEILHAERRRSMELHKLLADMKNLLSAAPARFIFVGGRNLHDEWLADQTARQPLLTNIFDVEVYLPSLLTDHSRREEGRWEDKVAAYVEAQFKRAESLHKSLVGRRLLPSFGLRLEEHAKECFVDVERGENRGGFLLEIKDCEDGSTLKSYSRQLTHDFVQFLTYRSMGNPKRLKELMGTFIRPVDRVVHASAARQQFDCAHVLSFDETNRFRIQLLATIYRHLAWTFESEFVHRDDKMTTSLFHMVDFLFKFHRRAFSWSNLERVEDLAHIHRAPDLRQVLEAIVETWSERFLHRIRNGMYDFRFRSNFAIELEHISHQSPEEMAAFNFTLDESQILKSVYETNIRRLKEKDGKELYDVVAGLGELHEFDQEYETARFYYRRAISLLDTELRDLTGGSPVLERSSPMLQILAGEEVGQENARLYMSWGIARLRLMLQVGMTFELSRNFERAEVEYQNAATLSRSLLRSMAGKPKPRERQQYEPGSTLDEFDVYPVGDGSLQLWRDGAGRGAHRQEERLHSLKHLDILFQPVFAQVWLSEKFGGGVDTSLGLVEKWLNQLRMILPFVRDKKVQVSQGAFHARHANFALIMAELHNKAGDLCFFKGRQLPTLDALDKTRIQRIVNGKAGRLNRDEGYLLRAHYHYAVALHELQRFITYRYKSSKYKLNIGLDEEEGGSGGGRWETISSGSWPDFVYRAAGGTLSDFAEAMLGRVSLFGVLCDLKAHWAAEEKRWAGEASPGGAPAESDLVDACTRWMESAPFVDQLAPPDDVVPAKASFEMCLSLAVTEKRALVLRMGSLESWLGKWEGPGESEEGREALGERAANGEALVRFGSWDWHVDASRLAVALNFIRVGAVYLDRGGYVEDSAREFLKIGEAVSSYLWWGVAVKRLMEWVDLSDPKSDKSLQMAAKIWDGSEGVAQHPYWDYLLDLAFNSLEKAGRLFPRSRKDKTVGQVYLAGDKVPTSAVTLACSLGLASGHWGRLQGKSGEREDVGKLLQSWLGEESVVPLQERLRSFLERHNFPVTNRLYGIRTLILDQIIDAREVAEADVEAVLNDVGELMDFAAIVNAPLHFTPMESGSTYGLSYLWLKRWEMLLPSELKRKKENWKADIQDRGELMLWILRMRIHAEDEMFLALKWRRWAEAVQARTEVLAHYEVEFQDWENLALTRLKEAGPRIEKVGRMALRDLSRSEQSSTMRRAFYENISNMYYLYDDFNDRQIHFNHGMQMAGLEFVALLKQVVRGPREQGPEFTWKMEKEAPRPSPDLTPPPADSAGPSVTVPV